MSLPSLQYCHAERCKLITPFSKLNTSLSLQGGLDREYESGEVKLPEAREKQQMLSSNPHLPVPPQFMAPTASPGKLSLEFSESCK